MSGVHAIDWNMIFGKIIDQGPSWITALGTAIAVLLGLVNRSKIEMVHQATNGMADKWNSVTRAAALAEGVLLGKQLAAAKSAAIAEGTAAGREQAEAAAAAITTGVAAAKDDADRLRQRDG